MSWRFSKSAARVGESSAPESPSARVAATSRKAATGPVAGASRRPRATMGRVIRGFSASAAERGELGPGVALGEGGCGLQEGGDGARGRRVAAPEGDDGAVHLRVLIHGYEGEGARGDAPPDGRA